MADGWADDVELRPRSGAFASGPALRTHGQLRRRDCGELRSRDRQQSLRESGTGGRYLRRLSLGAPPVVTGRSGARRAARWPALRQYAVAPAIQSATQPAIRPGARVAPV